MKLFTRDLLTMGLSKFAIILGTMLAVSAEHHPHAHRHADNHIGSPVQPRAPNPANVWVPGPTTTIYELNGQQIDAAKVSAGLASGYYVLVTESTTLTSASSSSSASAAEFFQATTTSSPSSPPSSAYGPPPSSDAAPAAASSTSIGASSGSSGGAGLDTSFPNDSIPCSTFPSAYGPIAADYLGLQGWTGIQNVPGYSPGAGSISFIQTVTVGSLQGCTPNSFCSYACPAGYYKTQWPPAQGNTGQSVGGLYCNSNGMLELSRSSVQQLCTPGTGQVKVKNNTGSKISICGTDYPGTESETIALGTDPGQTYDLTCPDAQNSYMHGNKFTSAQYYINPKGVDISEACQWQAADAPGNWHGAPGNIGNWAPVNIGASKGPTGATYIALFPNIPTNPGGTLDFSINITGDITGTCSYQDGKFWNNGVSDPTGCTVLVNSVAEFVFQ